jgi:hypothetical protein
MNFLQQPRVKLYALIIAILLVILFAIYLLIPAIVAQSEAKQTLQSKLRELEDKKLRVQNFTQFGPQEQFELATIRKKLPESANLELALRELRSIEQLTGVQFSNYQFSPPADGSEAIVTGVNGNVLVPLEASFSFRAKKTQLDVLLRELEETERFFHVSQLSLTSNANIPVSTTTSDDEMSCSMTLKMYYIPSLASFYERPLPVRIFE